jgi:hypothetical protein
METGALQSIFNQNSQQVKTASLRPGQIVNGIITKLFPEQIAEVQIGSHKMVAQLEVPLSANERYWFQVQPGEGKVHLKVMAAGADDPKQASSLNKILGEFSLPATKENLELIRYFVKEQLPVNREILQQASEWVKTANPRSSGMEAVKMMLTRGLPLTQATYSALYTASNDHSLAELIGHLQKAFGNGPQTDTALKVFEQLEKLLPAHQAAATNAAQQSDEGAAILSSFKIKEFLSALGMSYEQQLAQAFNGQAEEHKLQADTLKPQLMRLLAEQPLPEVKEAAEQLLNKITGFQILSQESGPMQQLIVQIPLILGGSVNEVTMQWSGQKTADGKIDADFCRVLFYLKLEHIDDTIVDMQVQNRVMSIQVHNDHPLLKKFADQLVPNLKENLAKIDYHLSALNFAVQKPAPTGKENKLADLYRQKEYSRVDIKI